MNEGYEHSEENNDFNWLKLPTSIIIQSSDSNWIGTFWGKNTGLIFIFWPCRHILKEKEKGKKEKKKDHDEQNLSS